MSRVESMAAERWRVTVMQDDRVTHESLFDDGDSSRHYYRHVDFSEEVLEGPSDWTPRLLRPSIYSESQ